MEIGFRKCRAEHLFHGPGDLHDPALPHDERTPDQAIHDSGVQPTRDHLGQEVAPGEEPEPAHVPPISAG
jgi:hypothetical protein